MELGSKQPMVIDDLNSFERSILLQELGKTYEPTPPFVQLMWFLWALG